MGVIEASGFARKGVPMTGKQSAAEWLRGIVEESYRAEAYPSCAGIARTFFGLECPDTRQHGSCILMMLTAIADRIDAERALPEGIEWPRFEDGELVSLGDEVDFHGVTVNVHAVKMCADSIGLLVVDGAATAGTIRYDYGERVKRPTPKVLDADGAPIEVGDVVYFVGGSGRAYAVAKVDANGVDHSVDIVEAKDGCPMYSVNPERLTHERPDSWERIEEDAKLAPRAYLEARGMNPEKTERVASMMADLVRRAKALAKGEQR